MPENFSVTPGIVDKCHFRSAETQITTMKGNFQASEDQGFWITPQNVCTLNRDGIVLFMQFHKLLRFRLSGGTLNPPLSDELLEGSFKAVITKGRQKKHADKIAAHKSTVAKDLR